MSKETVKPDVRFLTNRELLIELKKRGALVLIGTVEDLSRTSIPGSWGLEDRATLIVLRGK